MKATQIRNNPGLRPQKLSVKETSHFVLEPTMRCNMRCRACYNHNRDHTKTLDQIRTEIEQACEKSILETVSILGGEPTLHPELADIIGHIKGRGLICQLLTNGLVLLEPNGGE